ncbi:MAG: FIST C-terminal domain-containing protein, partial [Candidatus Marinimicrobia bacterium]|nr:FIST C-terminal domain-containing protein [Candidatus Neomarinimicrobiota bacterium]
MYRDIVEKHSNKRFQKDNFFDISKCHPFGISKLGTERIVRDPFMRAEDDSLICVGEVPQDSFIDILKGDVNSLVTAAGKALRLAKEGFTEETSNKTVLF